MSQPVINTNRTNWNVRKRVDIKPVDEDDIYTPPPEDFQGAISHSYEMDNKNIYTPYDSADDNMVNKHDILNTINRLRSMVACTANPNTRTHTVYSHHTLSSDTQTYTTVYMIPKFHSNSLNSDNICRVVSRMSVEMFCIDSDKLEVGINVMDAVSRSLLHTQNLILEKGNLTSVEIAFSKFDNDTITDTVYEISMRVQDSTCNNNGKVVVVCAHVTTK